MRWYERGLRAQTDILPLSSRNVASLSSLDQIMLALGYIVLAAAAIILAYALIILVLTMVSIRKGRFYFPRLLKPGIIVVEGLLRSLWKAFRLDDRELTSFAIRLRNQMSHDQFCAVPMERRAIFLPQCLRSADCPADLTTEGLVCTRCMRCGIGKIIDRLEEDDRRVFIVPGSTFIKRMVKKYRPLAIVGVGCLLEVKEGLEMAESINLVAMGVVTSKDGCVETTMEWENLLEVVRLVPGDPLTAISLAP